MEEILEKTEKTEEELNHLLDVLKKKIILIPMEEILPYADEAEKISPDPDDVAYLALAFILNCAIWSQDRKLRENQSQVQIYSTEELIKGNCSNLFSLLKISPFSGKKIAPNNY